MQTLVIDSQLAHEAQIWIDLWATLFNQIVGILPVHCLNSHQIGNGNGRRTRDSRQTMNQNIALLPSGLLNEHIGFIEKLHQHLVRIVGNINALAVDRTHLFDVLVLVVPLWRRADGPLEGCSRFAAALAHIGGRRQRTMKPGTALARWRWCGGGWRVGSDANFVVLGAILRGHQTGLLLLPGARRGRRGRLLQNKRQQAQAEDVFDVQSVHCLAVRLLLGADKQVGQNLRG